MDLVEQLLAGNRIAAARMISLVENGSSQADKLLQRIHAYVGKAYRIGVTGPPGAGKSTLVDQLTYRFRKDGKSVGIIAVDPTSPFSGGALLGDRIRMKEGGVDSGVFIRSMATRGSLGGLAYTSGEAADILDVMGKDIIIMETVGVGQSELDIAEAADTTVVVLVPEAGDSIQTMKAGLMEIADIFVVNKADHQGADKMVQEISLMLDMRPEYLSWTPPVLQSIATDGRGVEGLYDRLYIHRKFLESNNLITVYRKKRIKGKVKMIVEKKIRELIWGNNGPGKQLEEYVKCIMEDKETPYSVAQKLVDELFLKHSKETR